MCRGYIFLISKQQTNSKKTKIQNKLKKLKKRLQLEVAGFVADHTDLSVKHVLVTHSMLV